MLNADRLDIIQLVLNGQLDSSYVTINELRELNQLVDDYITNQLIEKSSAVMKFDSYDCLVLN